MSESHLSEVGNEDSRTLAWRLFSKIVQSVLPVIPPVCWCEPWSIIVYNPYP